MGIAQSIQAGAEDVRLCVDKEKKDEFDNFEQLLFILAETEDDKEKEERNENDLEERIRKRAYYIWLETGKDDAVANWVEAKMIEDK